MTLNKDMAIMLTRCKRLAAKLATTEESIKELRMQTISSPKMDGMPHGSAQGDASAGRLARLEAREREYERDRRDLTLLRQTARRVIKLLDAKRRIFYEAYYIDAEKASAARKEAGISERTASRYINDVIKKETGD